ncbi:MAG: CPBP family intramembrane glutamic endopeptidase [Candidatus Aenigmatarchaeota archaeon]
MGLTKKGLPESVSLSLLVSAFGVVLITLYGIATKSLDFSTFDILYFGRYVIWAFVQELAFRGFIQTRIQKASTPIVAIAVTGVVFSLLHLLYGVQLVLFTLPAGLVWGFMMWKRPNIAGPALSHIILGQFLLQFVL